MVGKFEGGQISCHSFTNACSYIHSSMADSVNVWLLQ